MPGIYERKQFSIREGVCSIRGFGTLACVTLDAQKKSVYVLSHPGRQLGRFRRTGALGHQLERFPRGGSLGHQLQCFRTRKFRTR